MMQKTSLDTLLIYGTLAQMTYRNCNNFDIRMSDDTDILAHMYLDNGKIRYDKP